MPKALTHAHPIKNQFCDSALQQPSAAATKESGQKGEALGVNFLRNQKSCDFARNWLSCVAKKWLGPALWSV
jgi:hypothetical protein